MRFSAKVLFTASSVAITAVPVFAQGKAGMGFGSPNMLIMMALMFFIIYFLMIRPEQKKQKERVKLLASVKKGDKILTSAGITGTISNVKDTTVMVKIAETTIVEFSKSAIVSILNSDGSEKAIEKTEKDEKDKK